MLRILCLDLHPIFNYIVCFLMSSFLNSLYILEINPLPNLGLMKIFSYSLGCHFCLIFFGFMRFHLLSVDFSVFTIGDLISKLSPVPVSKKVFPTFFSIKVSISGLILRSLIQLDLSFVQDDRYGFFYAFRDCSFISGCLDPNIHTETILVTTLLCLLAQAS